MIDELEFDDGESVVGAMELFAIDRVATSQARADRLG